jgi:pimeloyl-ACP methyl ester carboxylesterase
MIGSNLVRELLTVVAISGACTAPPPQLALTPCQRELQCGTLTVAENRAAPSRTITLDIVVVPATGDRTLPPLYYLDGGPGVDATGSAQFWVTDGAIHRRHRDIVLVDQRGTGARGFACPEVTVNAFDPAAVTACRDRLTARADLAHYTTAEAVADLEAVRAALGHAQIDIAGLSYGTRVAQEYLRAHPDRVRAMVLLGALPPDEKLPLPFPSTAQAVLDRLVSQCAADPDCHTAIPDLAGDIARLPRGGRAWELIRAQLTTTTGQRALPWLLHQAAAGRAEIAAAPAPDHGSNGLLLSVSCPEDTLHITDAEQAAARTTVFGDYRIAQQRRACATWGTSPIDVPRSFVTSNAPVLLVVGEMDHVTPPEWSAKIASHLPNARVVTIPLLGHFPIGLSHPECYEAIIAAFFERRELPVACIATMQPPPFTVR